MGVKAGLASLTGGIHLEPPNSVDGLELVMRRRPHLHPLLGLLLAVVPTLPATGEAAGTSAPADAVTSSLKAAGPFSKFSALWSASDVSQILASGDSFTVLAPTDDAFARLPAGVFGALLKAENRAVLNAVVRYHVAPGVWTPTSIADAAQLPSLLGPTLEVRATQVDLVAPGAVRPGVTPEVISVDRLRVDHARLIPHPALEGASARLAEALAPGGGGGAVLALDAVLLPPIANGSR